MHLFSVYNRPGHMAECKITQYFVGEKNLHFHNLPTNVIRDITRDISHEIIIFNYSSLCSFYFGGMWHSEPNKTLQKCLRTAFPAMHSG